MRWGKAIAGTFAGFLLTTSVPAAEPLVIKGSNTFGEELGPALFKAFQARTPGLVVDLESKGTATGLTALFAGECDIASASRMATEDEARLARSRGLKLTAHLIGYYGVAVIVNKQNPVAQLSDAQVRDIFTGAIANWKEVGGPDAPIQLYIRDAASGTHLGFQELALERKPYAKTAQALPAYSAIADAVKKDRHGIGYVGMQLVEGADVRAVGINGIRPSIAAVNEGLYPYARQLWLYTNADKESVTARRFIEFARSQRGQEILATLGFVRRFERRMSFPSGPGL